jgi:hypothetical protein
MLADLDMIRDMIGSVLAFARDDTKHEPRSLIDLSALVEGICHNASDAGEPVTFSGPRGATISGRPTALRRAVSNLVDNAVKYGRSAAVSLIPEAERVVITVEDEGPGTSRSEREKVFEPSAPVLITIRPRSSMVRSGGGIFGCLACGPPRHVRSWKPPANDGRVPKKMSSSRRMYSRSFGVNGQGVWFVRVAMTGGIPSTASGTLSPREPFAGPVYRMAVGFAEQPARQRHRRCVASNRDLDLAELQAIEPPRRFGRD